MKPGIPWSVKGIEPEVREAAKTAARRAGMTLGEWLNTVILDQSDDAEGAKAPAAASREEFFSDAPRPRVRREDTTVRLEDIAHQLSQLAQRERESATILPYEPPRGYREDGETMNRILERIDGNERQTVEAFTAVNERLSVLGRQISKAPAYERPEDVPGFSALETAIRNVVEHLELTDKRTRESLRAMQDKLAEMTQRAIQTDAEEVLRTAPAFTALEDRMSGLLERLDHADAQRNELPEVVRVELNQLADRIEEARGLSQAGAEQAHTAAVVAAQTELRDIEGRILSLLKEAQATFVNQSASASDLQTLRGEIAALNQRLDELGTHAASHADLQSLQEAVDDLTARMSRGPDMGPLTDLDSRIAALKGQLDEAGESSRHQPQFEELERRIADLDARLADALREQGAGQAMGDLRTQLADIGVRLEKTEQQVGAITTIEQAVRQLYQGLEENRTFASQVAEDAANRAAERVLSAARGTMGEPSQELQALRDGLAAVRDSAASADQRNQETLVAVHDTLEQIVEKLAELETAAAGHQVAANLAQQTQAVWTPPVPEAAPVEPAQIKPAADTPFFDPAGFFADPQVDKPVEVATEPRLPPEPSLESPKPEPAPAASVLSDPPDMGAEDGDDFIAAARRAAQAAATRSSGPAVEELRPAAPEPKRSRFSLPFIGRGKRPAAVTYVNGKPFVEEERRPKLRASNPVADRRRKLILAGIVLLAAVSAVTFNLMARSSTPAKQSTSIEAPAQAAPAMPVAAAKSDNVVTGSLPAQKTDPSLLSIVAEPGSAPLKAELPPPETGTPALRQAAAGGDAQAQFIIASRYLDGQGVEQNLPQAALWYQRAASGGLAPAQYRLATMLERGKGMPQDVAAALLWYQRAAAAGNVKSMHNAAVILASNQVGQPKFGEAYLLFHEAANFGLKDSQFNVAVLAERGLGAPVDLPEAYFWYAAAGRQGDADAGRRAQIVGKKLDPKQVMELENKLNGWKPATAVEAANVVTVNVPAWSKAPAAAASPKSDAPQAMSNAAPANPVMEAQQLLGKLGFSIGKPDGNMGVKTQNAIRLFQLQSGIEVTGEVTPQLIEAMRAKAG